MIPFRLVKKECSVRHGRSPLASCRFRHGFKARLKSLSCWTRTISRENYG
jgi:hypothetical protein